MTVSVLIADDPLVRTGLRGMLDDRPEFEAVGGAANGEEAVELARRLVPDVVLMDLRMPGTDGVAATAEGKPLLAPTSDATVSLSHRNASSLSSQRRLRRGPGVLSEL